MLALLALACFPLLAQAGSAGIQYEDSPPTATTHGSNIPSGSGGSPAHTSDTRDDGSASHGSTNSGSSEEGPSKESESDTAGGVPAKAGNDGNGGNGQGNPAKGAKNEDLSGAKPVSSSGAKSDDGGDSSPLVPILIAVAVLAAISVGVVAFRQRRRDGSDARISPEAS
ncbi:MAG TPA: hypothetical protein VHQ43_07555 [Solirubrobacterales bacterium]|nr:hypothetical protein [Solirubrobacterales bacterium]